jgi:acetyl-CoA C-acetyltransferase
MARILSGHHHIVLVLSHTKESQAEKSLVENAAFDAILLRQLGLDFTSAAAMQAKRYMYKYGIRPEQCAKVAVKNLRNGLRNPYAHKKGRYTVDDILASDKMIDPLTALQVAPKSEGMVAIILASAKKAKK